MQLRVALACHLANDRDAILMTHSVEQALCIGLFVGAAFELNGRFVAELMLVGSRRRGLSRCNSEEARMDLNGLTAIVTGGASGLGEATVRALVAEGARVAIFDLNAERGAALVSELGAAVMFRSVDVSDEASVTEALRAVEDAFGIPGAAVNCAGIVLAKTTLGKTGPHPLDAYAKVIDVNLKGTFNVLRLAAARMAEAAPGPDGERGVIVNTASVAAFDGQRGQAAYAASKGGIAATSLPVARDLARNGIRVNAIAPGLFLTPMAEELGEDVCAQLAKDVVFPKRLGKPSEFADAVLFLIRNTYMNGETLRLDGAVRLP